MTVQVLCRQTKLLCTFFPYREISFQRSFSISKKLHSEVRVRFAPSPTGFLHLGGLRTALYNYLLAKSKKGKFILRIEDTDQTRLVQEAAEKLESILNWAQITPDESPIVGGPYGPYVQSQRTEIYLSHVQKLLDNGSAYKCFCTETRMKLLRKDFQRRGETPKYDNRCRHLSPTKIEKLEGEGASYCVRFKLEEITEPYHDLVCGPILNNIAEQEGDPIIMKSDGFPTYHLANVVDDHLMKVTHVLRGEEWQVSTPKHLLLYKAFGWDPPKYAHLPLIRNSDGTKLSKRQGDLHVESLKSQGYSPRVVLNFVTSTGGGFTSREHNAIYNVEDLVERFQLERVNASSCKLEMEKLLQFNQMDLQQRLEIPSSAAEVVTEVRQLLYTALSDKISSGTIQEENLCDEKLLEILMLAKDRISQLKDLLSSEFSYFWIVPDDLDLQQLPTMSVSPADVLESLIESLSSIPESEFTSAAVVKCVKSVGKTHRLKTPVIMILVRKSLSGLKQGPPVGEMLSILGKEISLDRLKRAHSLLS